MLHMLKLCVGIDTLAQMSEWQRKRKPLCHWTRNWPKRTKEITAGGSIYWVIKGQIRVRQRILSFERREDDEGVWCAIMLGRRLVKVHPRSHRAFQGWRYLEPKDAPADLAKGEEADELPEKLASELRALGLI